MQLGITTIQRDRAPWIKEWIAFHYLVGFRKFYIYLHNCKDNSYEVLTELKKRFDIKIVPIDSEMDMVQQKCYQDSCNNYLNEVDWMAFIDGDEFLFPTAHTSMEDALNEFSDKKISAVAVYISCFGSSGHIAEPPGLIIENYRYRAETGFHDNHIIKSIVRGGQQERPIIVKCANFIKFLGTYDENLRPVFGGRVAYEPTYGKFRINHYVAQSRSYYLNWKRNSGNAAGERLLIREEDWWTDADRNDVLDNSMDKFIGPLKNILNSI